MIKRKALICSTLMLLCASACAESMFTVTRYNFAPTVMNHEPQQPFSDTADYKSAKSLYFFVEIAVNETGLKYLKAFGRFPVYVAWGKDGHLVTRLTDIGIKTSEWETNREKLLWAYGSSGTKTFLWRTQASRTDVGVGQHYVSVLDPNRKAVAQSDGVGAFRPAISITKSGL